MSPNECASNVTYAVPSSKWLASAYGEAVSPQDVFYYSYAILYATAYRDRYVELLKTEFPRIPFTANLAAFRRLAELGKELADLHLLLSPKLDTPEVLFNGDGSGMIATGKKQGVRYVEQRGAIFINETQYFAPVGRDTWEYRIGGFQVCEKWLDDRKGRRLSLDDVRLFCRIASAVALTIRLQASVDAIYVGAMESIIHVE